MISRLILATSFAATLVLTACNRKTVVIEVPSATPIAEPVARTKTFETARLGRALEDFERAPSAERRATVKKAFADLDGEIAELEALVAKRNGSDREEAALKLKNLELYRTQETTRFAAAEANAGLSMAPSTDGRSGAEKIEDGARRAGDAVENAGKKLGDSLKDVVR